MVRNLPAIQESQVWSLDQEDPLEKRMATHSSILDWRIPWTKGPGRSQLMGSQRVRHNWAANTFNSNRELVVAVQSLNRVWLFATPWTATRQASLSFTISWSLLRLMSIELVMPSNYLVLCCPFSSCLQSFPASEYFPMHQLFALGGQRIGPSASIFPMNIQHWFPLGWTGLISLQSKGLSWVFSNTTVPFLESFTELFIET